MNCTLTEDQHRQLRRKVAGNLIRISSQGMDFDMKSYIRSIYDLINNSAITDISPEDKELLALDYSRLTPNYIMQIVAVDTPIRNHLRSKGFSMDQLSDLISHLENEDQGLQNTKDYLGLGKDIVEEIRDANTVIREDSISQVVDTTDLNIENPPSIPVMNLTGARESYDPQFRAIPPTIMADRDQEALSWDRKNVDFNIPNPSVSFYYTVKRKILDTISQPGVDSDSSLIDYQGIGPLYLNIISATKVPNGQIRSGVDPTSQAHKEGVVMIIVDKYNSPVYFQNNGDVDYQGNGKMAYYLIRKTEGLVDQDGNVTLRPEDHESAKALSRQTGISIQEAQESIASQIRVVNDIRGYILKDPEKNSVRSIINGGSQGYTQFDFKLNTPIARVNFFGETFSPYISRENNKMTGEESGKVYFKMKSMGNTAIEIERPSINSETARKLTSILIDNLQVKDPTGRTTSPVTASERQSYLDSYFYTNKETLSILVNDDGTYAVRFKGDKLDLSSKELVEQARGQLLNYFTSLGPQRRLTKLNEYQKNNIINSPSEYRLGAALKTNDGSFWAIEYPKLNISKDLLGKTSFNDVNLEPQSDGKILVTKTKKSYTDWIRDNFIIHYELNGAGQLLKLNSYFTFEPEQTELNKVYGITNEVNLTTPESQEQSSRKSDSDELLNDIWNDPELQKNLAQRSLGKKATEDQILAAKVWYESHPMSKYIPFKQMFQAINTKSPSSVATWSSNGIILYKGSDYSELYHEAWHGFTQSFLTSSQKKDLYNEARKATGTFTDYKGSKVKFSNSSDLQLEEYLAEEFRSFMLSDGKSNITEPIRRSIFQKILDFLRQLFGLSNVDDTVLNPESNKIINELFTKLRVGNIQEYTFSEDNYNFDILNKGIEKVDSEDPLDSLSYEDSSLILDSVDSIISEFIDKANSGLTDQDKLYIASIEDKVNKKQPITTEEADKLKILKSKQTYKYTSTLIQTIKGRQRCYQYVQKRFAEIHNELVDEYNQLTNELAKESLKKKIDALNWSVKNFGNTDDISKNKPGVGVIGYHVIKSKFLSEEDKDLFFDREFSNEEESYQKGREGYDRAGNEVSLKDLASKEVLYLLKSLHARDKSGNIIVNKLGIPQLVSFDQIWNRLARTLQNTRTPQEMYRRLLIEANSYPAISQLLNKLGPLSSQGSNEYLLWTNFWQTMNKTRIPLVQMTVETTTRDDEGNILSKPTYSVKIGQATAEFKKVGQRWNSYFKSTKDNPYILYDNEGNYLDIDKVLKDFTDSSVRGKEFEFFKAIGINLDDKEEIRDALRKGIGGAIWIRKALKYIQDRGDTSIRDLNTIFNSYEDSTIAGKKISGKKDEKSRYNQLQELQARYSDDHSNFMVTNAEGNTQFEHSLNNTLTVITNTINSVGSYKELISMPYMDYLDIKRNPFVKGSLWMNSIFDFSTPEGKKRRQSDLPGSPFVTINLNNLSGVALMQDGLMSNDGGIASASADEFTKLILDFHLTVGNGQPELMRHADKGTSFSVTLSNIFTEGKNKSMYIDTLSFINKASNTNPGHNEAFNIILPHISAELERINQLKALSSNGVTDFDFDYVKRGQEFVIFDDTLSPETKRKLYNLNDTLVNYASLNTNESKELLGNIYDDLLIYFNKQVDNTANLLKKSDFIADSLISKLSGEARNSKVPADATTIKQAAIKSFVYNSWIHNLESLVLLYGDLALYNMNKEEFHKRNAGAGSTGNIYRTDQDAINYVNNVLGRGYAREKGLQEKPFNGTFDSAVLADNDVQSKYIQEYKEAIESDIRSRMQPIIDKLSGEARISKQKDMESKIAEAVAPYENMTEGDAQGWITFDAYRILLNLEGKWDNRSQESIYQDLIKDNSVPSDKVTQFFATQKCQYYGQLSSEGLPIIAFHKFSLFPLIPSVIKGTNLEKLHDKMIAEGVDYALFKSGSKVGTITKSGKPDPLYSDTTSRSISDRPFTKNTIYLEYLKDQLEIAPEYKGKVIFSTQMRKLIEDGLVEGGVATDFMPGKSLDERRAKWSTLKESDKLKVSKRYSLLRDYENNISKLTEIKKRELLKEANWKMGPDGVPQGNLKDLMKFVSDELSRQDLSDHELNFIQVDKHGKLVHDLSMSLSADKIERMLNALVIKRLVRQKVNGEGLIQVSGAGFERLDAYTNPTEKDLKKWGTNDLPTYHKGKNGKTTAMKVKIAIQGKFFKLFRLEHTDGQPIRTLERLNEVIKDEKWLDTNDHRRMITMVGVRIPVQGLNSMEFMEVYEFLPTEAGNIIIPPAEIVAKSGSDFDIDKLTVMMPSYQVIDGKLSIAKQRSAKEARQLYDKVIKSKIELNSLRDSEGNIIKNQDPSVDNLLRDIFGSAWDVEYTQEEIDEILDEEGLESFEDFSDQLNGSKSVENDIIWNLRQILELPENYTKLIRPNGTDIVKPLADELFPSVTEFNPKDKIFANTSSSKVSGTRVLEIPYNLYKHSSNNIGKQTLGLGAVDNTYNTLFNRVGAYMNPSGGISKSDYDVLSKKSPSDLKPAERKKLNSYRRQIILMPHNKIKVDGQDAISLSHIEDANGENIISDVISQLINGWVDIAKDAWIFNIQGNKEVAPTLLFMVQAGVPFDTAVYFVSLPLVREYVKQQKLAKSTFSGPLGKAPSNLSFYRNRSREEILLNPSYGFNLTKSQVSGPGSTKNIYNETVRLTSQVLGEDGLFDNTRLLESIKDYSTSAKAGNTLLPNDFDRAAFLHFIELENMSKSVRDIKMRMNFDTSKSSTLFEAQNRVLMVESLREDNRIPVIIIDNLLDGSPISSFYIQPFQISIWKDLFKLRNHDVLNNFLSDKFRTGISNEVAATFGDPEKFANEFRNDLLSYIFQNNLRTFSLADIKSYKGYNIDKVSIVQKVKSLQNGAFVKGDILYIDEKQLRNDFSSGAFSKKEYRDRGLATVSSLAFPIDKEFFKFVFERENLRSIYPIEQANTMTEFINYSKVFSENIKPSPNESLEQFNIKKPGMLYEMWLRDKALDNVFNGWKLFRGSDTYADQYFRILDEFPQLKETYSILNSLSISEAKGYTNLRLSDSSLDGDRINVLNENLLQLSDKNVKKVDSIEDNSRISEFFSKFPIVAFLQSGLNTKSSFSMVRIVPQDKFISVMENPVKQYVRDMNPVILNDYFNKFIIENSSNSRSRRVRYKDYTSELTLSQSLTAKDINTESSQLVPYGDNIFTYKMSSLGKDATTLLNNNPDTIFVYNGATESSVNPIKLDYVMFKSPLGNKLALPTRKRYSGGKSNEQYKDVTYSDMVTGVDPHLKMLIDEAIESLKGLQRSGMKIAFSDAGYGQYMIGADPLTTLGASTSTAVSPVTFLYLSEQLFINFGYINPNYDRTRTGRVVIQSSQPISDDIVKSMMSHCFLT